MCVGRKVTVETDGRDDGTTKLVGRAVGVGALDRLPRHLDPGFGLAAVDGGGLQAGAEAGEIERCLVDRGARSGHVDDRTDAYRAGLDRELLPAVVDVARRATVGVEVGAEAHLGIEEGFEDLVAIRKSDPCGKTDVAGGEVVGALAHLEGRRCVAGSLDQPVRRSRRNDERVGIGAGAAATRRHEDGEGAEQDADSTSWFFRYRSGR